MSNWIWIAFVVGFIVGIVLFSIGPELWALLCRFGRWVYGAHLTLQPTADPHWEAVAVDGIGNVVADDDVTRQVAWLVRWSEPGEDGRYLWVGHYYSGPHTSLSWCRYAAMQDAKLKNEESRGPWEWSEYRRGKVSS